MESRWLRMFLFFVVIPAFLGITLKVSSAGNLGEPPSLVIPEVKAFRTRAQAESIKGERPVNGENMLFRAKQLNRNIVAGTKANTMSDISSLVKNVAGRLVEIQRTTDNGYDSNSRGWPRDLIDSNSKTAAGQPDPDDVLPSNYGTVGMGLLMAYAMDANIVENTVTLKTDSAVFAAAKKAGDALVEADANSLVSTDIIFLYGLSRVCSRLANTELADKYKNAGLASLEKFAANTPADVYTYYDTIPHVTDQQRSLLKQLKLWQLASWVEVAKLYAADGGDSALDTWANGLMTKIVGCQDPAGGFYYDKPADNKYYVRTAGHAKVVEVLKRFYDDNADYKERLKNGLSYLKGLQYDKAYVSNDNPAMRGAFYFGGQTVATTTASGTTTVLTPWNMVTLQDQCYGIQAMAYNFQTTWVKRDNYKSTHWAANYLIKSMTAVGPEGYEIFVDRVNFNPASDISTDAAIPRTDRNSEAIQALYYSCKEGDINRSGNIIAANALEVARAIVRARRTGNPLPQQLNGPEIVAADRNNDYVIDDSDIEAILSDAVGEHQEQIRSFLGR